MAPDPLAVAELHQRQRALLAAAASKAVERLWRQVDPARITETWAPRLAPAAFGIVAGAQAAAVRTADTYTTSVLDAQGVDPVASGRVAGSQLVGIASDGRPLQTLLLQPVVTAKTAIGQGVPLGQAMARGLFSLSTIVSTQVADAGRAADGVALVARRHATGYVRMLRPPSCSRCALLAGKHFRWNAGFARHPHCDCTAIPAADDTAGDLTTDPRAYFDSLSGAEQDRLFTKAGAQAIRDGADVGQVVNARRGMQTAQVYGRQLDITLEGVTVRGLAGKRLGDLAKAKGQRYRASTTPRLMPESIYRIAGDDRQEALRLLRRYGFLI